MLKVWGRKTSINVQKVMWAVGELGLKYERVDAGGTFGGLDTPEYQRLNPNRLVPVIVDDGFVLWESNAIVRHLAQKYGRGELSPQDEQSFALADQWMDWTLTTLYSDIISTCFLGLIRTAAKDRNVAQIAAAAKRVGEKLGLLDAHLKGRAYILGGNLSIADIAVGTLMYRYYNLDIQRPSMPNVEAWCGRIAQRPAYREHVMIDFNSLKVPGA
ncbi:MAG: glutathione S-transferase family protein [Hyphomicrobiaceae bacterium]|nr:MAG: glutathione S-transferase family protein [Hyphomicrobiaceae bacterium]